MPKDNNNATIATNGFAYEVLEQAVIAIKQVPGLTCEIGLRKGGGTKLIMDTLGHKTTRTHIAIDPFGNLPYFEAEKRLKSNGPYPNSMMKEALEAIYGDIKKSTVNFLFFPMEDTEFFTRYGDGVPVYKDRTKEIINEYALVFFDGPHTLEVTMRETVFFQARTVPGSVFVFDDVHDYYDHRVVKNYLTDTGWEVLDDTTDFKHSYRKKGE